MEVSGGCHCRSVRFAISLASRDVQLLDCNCSICTRTGYLHLIASHADFDLISGRDALVSYRFGSGTAAHLFCRTCGVKGFYKPRSHPDAWSVNFRCLDEGHGLTPVIRPFDGRDWEAARAVLASPP